MDQPAHEIMRVEKILDAVARYDELQETKRAARAKNRQRFANNPEGTMTS